MFSEIFRFELKYRLRRPATYIYFGLLFSIGFPVHEHHAGGAFKDAYRYDRQQSFHEFARLL